MGEMLRNIREAPVTDENLVDIRRLLASGAPFNLLLSFGFDKLSTRSVFCDLGQDQWNPLDFTHFLHCIQNFFIVSKIFTDYLCALYHQLSQDLNPPWTDILRQIIPL